MSLSNHHQPPGCLKPPRLDPGADLPISATLSTMNAARASVAADALARSSDREGAGSTRRHRSNVIVPVSSPLGACRRM